MYRKVIKPISIAFCMTLMLSACGEEANDTSVEVKPPSSKTITALNGLATAKVGVPTSLDLTSYVIGDNASLVDIYSDNLQCESSVGSGLSIDLMISSAGRCDYTYTVSDEHGQKSTANMVVVTSSGISNIVLLPVSYAVSINQMNYEINLENSVTAGYKLKGDIVIQSSTGSTAGDVEIVSDLKIRYNAPDAFGWNYIAYTLTNTDGNTLIGHVFISISDSVNHPPTITEPEYVYPVNVKMNELITIDLSSMGISNNFNYIENGSISGKSDRYLHNVTLSQCKDACVDEKEFICKSFDYRVAMNACDLSKSTDHAAIHPSGLFEHYSRTSLAIEDDGEWQLMNVKVIGATVSPLNSNDIKNKTFTFRAVNSGSYDVSYIVSDYMGGFSLGVIRIVVSDGISNTKVWGNIIVSPDITALAPLTQLEAKINSIGYINEGNEEIINGENYNISLWSPFEAKDYCALNGYRLPDTKELGELHSSQTGLERWPKEISYIGYDPINSQYSSFNMKTGVSGLVNDNNNSYYMSCINIYAVDMTLSVDDIAILAGEVVDINVMLLSKNDNKPIVDAVITSLSNEDVKCSNLTNGNGMASCQFKQTKSGRYNIVLQASDGNDLIYSEKMIGINIVASKKGVHWVIDKPQLLLIPNTPYKLNIKQNDKYGNEVHGITVSIDNSGIIWNIDGVADNAPSITYGNSGNVEVLIMGSGNSESLLRISSPNIDSLILPIISDDYSCPIKDGVPDLSSDCVLTTPVYVDNDKVMITAPMSIEALNRLASDSGATYGDNKTDYVIGPMANSSAFVVYAGLSFEAEKLCSSFNHVKLRGRENWQLAEDEISSNSVGRDLRIFGINRTSTGWILAYGQNPSFANTWQYQIRIRTKSNPQNYLNFRNGSTAIFSSFSHFYQGQHGYLVIGCISYN